MKAAVLIDPMKTSGRLECELTLLQGERVRCHKVGQQSNQVNESKHNCGRKDCPLGIH